MKTQFLQNGIRSLLTEIGIASSHEIMDFISTKWGRKANTHAIANILGKYFNSIGQVMGSRSAHNDYYVDIWCLKEQSEELSQQLKEVDSKTMNEIRSALNLPPQIPKNLFLKGEEQYCPQCGNITKSRPLCPKCRYGRKSHGRY